MTVDASKIACRLCTRVSKRIVRLNYGMGCSDEGALCMLSNYLFAANDNTCDISDDLHCILVNLTNAIDDYTGETGTETIDCGITVSDADPVGPCTTAIIVTDITE